MSLLTDAYQRRDRVGLVVFQKDRASLVLPPTNSVVLAKEAMADIPVGGKTPLSGRAAADLRGGHAREKSESGCDADDDSAHRWRRQRLPQRVGLAARRSAFDRAQNPRSRNPHRGPSTWSMSPSIKAWRSGWQISLAGLVIRWRRSAPTACSIPSARKWTKSSATPSSTMSYGQSTGSIGGPCRRDAPCCIGSSVNPSR